MNNCTGVGDNVGSSVVGVWVIVGLSDGTEVSGEKEGFDVLGDTLGPLVEGALVGLPAGIVLPGEAVGAMNDGKGDSVRRMLGGGVTLGNASSSCSGNIAGFSWRPGHPSCFRTADIDSITGISQSPPTTSMKMISLVVSTKFTLSTSKTPKKRASLIVFIVSTAEFSSKVCP